MTNSGVHRQVLVVDSPGAAAEATCALLLDAEFEVSLAASGAEALALLPGGSFSAAVVGASLPDMSGKECIRGLSQRDKELPCIAVASAPSLDDVIEMANLAVYGYLVRPFAPEQLLAMVWRAEKRRRFQSELHRARLGTAQLLGILQTIDTIQDRINNPLQALLGYTELLKENLPADSENAQQLADRVAEAGWRIADVVDKLRQVRRPVTKEWSAGETLDLEAASIPDHERRIHPRLISVMLARLPGRTGRRWYFVEDISQGGFAISIKDPAALLAVVDVELADPESGETYCCRAQCVWTDPRRSRAGLRFLEADPQLSARLRPADS